MIELFVLVHFDDREVFACAKKKRNGFMLSFWNLKAQLLFFYFAMSLKPLTKEQIEEFNKKHAVTLSEGPLLRFQNFKHTERSSLCFSYDCEIQSLHLPEPLSSCSSVISSVLRSAHRSCLISLGEHIPLRIVQYLRDRTALMNQRKTLDQRIGKIG